VKIIRKLLIFLLIVTVFTPNIYARIPGIQPEKRYSFGGYVKYLTRVVIPEDDSNYWDHLVHQRFNYEYRFSDILSINAGMRNRVLWGDSLDIPDYDELLTEDPGYFNLSWNWLDKDNIIGNTTLDRVYVDWLYNDWQFRAGRQRINWGMATLWNPNDLFNVYSMYDFDYEERPGTDALLLGRTLGFASRAEAVWAFGEDWDETSLAGRYLFNISGYDIHIFGGKKWIDLVTGAGFAGSVLGAGFNGEISYFHPYEDEWEGKKQKETTVATIEADYSVKGSHNFIWKASALYISNPEDPGSSLIYLNQPLTAKTISFTRWTGFGEVSFDITSLSRQVLGSVIYDDGSWYITASNTYSLADNWQLLFVWQHFDGDANSLFGENPSDMVYGRIRWSF
jgi:hypothetical protein